MQTILNIRAVMLGVILWMTGLSLFSQTEHTISGYIRDAADGESMPGAVVTLLGTEKGTLSNDYGFFSISLPEDTVTLSISYVGYSPLVHHFWLDRDTVLNYEMQAAGTALDEVIIVGKNENDHLSRNQMSYIRLPMQEVKTIPVLLGEVDILKSLQLLPGVQSGSEGGTGLYVRGGGPDQNLILLDEAPVYNASHVLGLFSIFNGDAIHDMELYKGGYPARFGGRLSSILDVKMKEGNYKRYEVSGGLGLISSRLTVEGPIVKNKASFILSGRRTYVDLFTRPLNAANADNRNWNVIPDYHFQDINAKVNFQAGPNDKLYLSGYFGKDNFQFLSGRFDFGLNWGNNTGTLRWNHIFNDKLFLNATVVGSDYDYNISYKYTDRELRLFSNIRDLTFKQDFDFFPSANHFVRFGFSQTQHRLQPRGVDGATSDSDFSFENATEFSSLESAAYVSDNITLGAKSRLHLGLRLSAFLTEGAQYLSPEPRLSYLYRINPNLSFKGSYARMNQYVHLISNSAVPLPTDIWYPSSERTRPERSDQVALGLNSLLWNGQIELNGELFGKYYQNLVEYSEGAQLVYFDDIERELTYGRGWSYGAEFFLRKQKGDLTGWIGYTLGWSFRQFDEINQGTPFPNKYDRRHDVSAVLHYKLNPKWTLSTNWVFGTGNAVTLPSGGFFITDVPELFGSVVPDYESRNGFRMPAYHRLDFSAIWSINPEKGHSELVFNAYNVYSRRNTYFIYFDPTLTVGDQNEVSFRNIPKQLSLFPIIPAITYNFRY